MKKKIKAFSIRKKLVFYSYIIITPILLFISMTLFLKNYDDSMQKKREASLKNVENLSDSVGMLLDSLVEFGTYISINQNINQILISDRVAELNKDPQLWLHEAPMNALQDMIALSGQIKTLAIYPENGVKPYLRCTDVTSYIKDVETVRKTQIYQDTVEERGGFLFRRVSKNGGETYFGNRTEKIVLYREIYDLSKRNCLGYLVIGASIEKYQQLCDNSLPSETAGIVVVSSDGYELLSCGSVPQETMDRILKRNETLDRESGFFKADGIEVYYCRNTGTGVVFYELMPKEEIGKDLLEIAATPLALLLGLLVGLYPILVLVSEIVSKPLKNLRIAMENFKQGDFTQKVEVNTEDEVGEVAACFNQMVDDIKELIDTNYVMELKEKESELNALQAQINPHFLYNTLDSLYWQATNDGNEKIAEDILALSQLFRLVLGQGTGIITIGNEKNMLEHYLHIQKMRFSDNLVYEILIDEDICEIPIPKLILQPFVENAVVHGFEKTGEDCEIHVTGHRAGDWIEFTIRDNGIGMSREQVEAIFEVDDAKRYAGQRIGRYAIKNVKERLELKYHSHFKLEIQSNEGVGTTVFLRIPYME